MATDLNNLSKKSGNSGLSWIRVSGRVQAISFAAVFVVAGSAYLLYTHAATQNLVQPAGTVTPTPTPALTPLGAPNGS